MFLFRRSRCRIPAARFSTPQKYDYVICIEHKSQCNFRKCECRYSTGIHTVRSSILVSSVSSFFSYLVLHFPFQIFQFASSMHGSYIPRSSLVAELCFFFFYNPCYSACCPIFPLQTLTPWSRVLEKLVLQLVKKFAAFIEPEGSSLYSQVPA